MSGGFDAELFDEFFDPHGDWKMGRRVSWESSRICTCRNARNGEPEPGCEFCFGNGRCYEPGVELWIGVSAYDMKRHRQAFGPLPMGTAVLTIPRNAVMASGETTTAMHEQVQEFDRIVLLDEAERRQIPLVKNRDDNHLQGDILEILSLRVSRGDERELRFVEGRDFVIDGQRVRWLGGPVDGQGYILDVRTRPTLYIFGSDVSHRNHGPNKELPKRIAGAPADIFDRSRRIGVGTGQ